MKEGCLALGWAERWKMRMQITVWMLLFTLRVLCWGHANITLCREVMSVPGVCVHISCPIANCGSKNLTGGQWTKCPNDKCQNCSGINGCRGNDTVEYIISSSSEDNCLMIIDVVKKEHAGCYQFSGQSNSSFKISIQEEPVISVPSLTDGKEATLSCSAPNPCPNTPPHVSLWLQQIGKSMTKKNVSEEWCSNGTLNSNLTFFPSTELHDAEVVCVANYGNGTTINTTKTLSYLRNPRIMGNVTLSEGDTLHLNCSADSYPSFINISWSFSGGVTDQQNTTQGVFSKANVSTEDAGEYKCTVELFKKTVTMSVNISVISPPQILETHCVRLDEDLECRCVCRGFPIPFVTWSKNFILNSQRHLIQGHIINFTMNSTIRLERTRFQMCPNVMKCVCKNDAGTVNMDITNGIKTKDKGPNNDKTIPSLRAIFIILVVSASTVIVISVALCFVGICKRCRAIKAEDEGVSLQAVNSQLDQTDTNNEEADEHTPLQRKPAAEAAAAGNGGMEELEREDTPGEHSNSGRDEAAVAKSTTEVDYASIDYSLLQTRDATAQKTEREETEYAEIQIKKQTAEEDEILQDEEDQTDTAIPEDEEQNQEPEEEEEVEV